MPLCLLPLLLRCFCCPVLLCLAGPAAPTLLVLVALLTAHKEAHSPPAGPPVACRRPGCTHLLVELLTTPGHAAALLSPPSADGAGGCCSLARVARELQAPGALLRDGASCQGVILQLGHSRVALVRGDRVWRCIHADEQPPAARRASLPSISAVEPCCVVLPPAGEAAAAAAAAAERGPAAAAAPGAVEQEEMEVGVEGSPLSPLLGADANSWPSSDADGAEEGDERQRLEGQCGGCVGVRVAGHNIAGGSDLPLCRQEGWYTSVDICSRLASSAGASSSSCPSSAASETAGSSLRPAASAAGGSSSSAGSTQPALAGGDSLALGLHGLLPGACELQVQHGHLLSASRPLLVLPPGAERAAAEVCELAAATSDGGGGTQGGEEEKEAAAEEELRRSMDAFLRDVGLVVAYLDAGQQQRQPRQQDGGSSSSSSSREGAGTAARPAGVASWTNHGAAHVVAAAARAADYAEQWGCHSVVELLLPACLTLGETGSSSSSSIKAVAVAAKPGAARGRGGLVIPAVWVFAVAVMLVPFPTSTPWLLALVVGGLLLTAAAVASALRDLEL